VAGYVPEGEKGFEGLKKRRGTEELGTDYSKLEFGLGKLESILSAYVYLEYRRSLPGTMCKKGWYRPSEKNRFGRKNGEKNKLGKGESKDRLRRRQALGS